MKDYIEERALEIADYIIEHKATVRQTAKRFGVSKSTIANVKHFFTLLGKMFFTLYGKEFFTYPGKKIFTSLRLPVGTGQGASAGRIPRGKSNTWHGAGSGPTSQW